MEVKKTGLTEPIFKKNPPGEKVGNLVRVRVLKRVLSNNFMVEIRGKDYVAHLEHNIMSRLFLARVSKTAPRLELQFIKSLDGEKGQLGTGISPLVKQRSQLCELPRIIDEGNDLQVMPRQ